MNHNLQLLQRLYLAASGKYHKYKIRLDKAVHTGRFYKLNKRKQSYLVSRLRRLYEKLKSLQTQLRLASAGATLALTLSVSNTSQAQSALGPFVRNDALNPLPPPIRITHPRPAVVDIDDDGDLDVFIGNQDGDIQFFRNDSPAGLVTQFREVTGSDNPLDGVSKGYNAALAMADVDKDGDFDLLIGTSYGDTYFFRNTGTAADPTFTEQTGSSNPFDGITGTRTGKYLQEALPVFVDFDGDTDIDLFIGSSYAYDFYTATSKPAIEYYENNGSGVFTQTADTGLGGALEFHRNVGLTFADINNDGALDAIVGSSEDTYVQTWIRGIEDQFTQSFGAWNPDTRTGNPFINFYVSKYSAPVAADFDDDGDLDFLVGRQNYYSEGTNLLYLENSDGKFTLLDQTELNISPFGGVDVGNEATPAFVDLDNDGDLDAILGEKYYGSLTVFINTDGIFFEDEEHQLTDILQPLSQTYDVIPVFVDIDNDGDQDLFASMDREIAFFLNDNGTFEVDISPINPPSTYNMSLAFIDVDNDGDLDALIGNDSYSSGPDIDYFQNTGSATTPVFVAATAPAPFNTQVFEENPTLFAVDIDHDGDTDLIVTDTYYKGWYSDGYASRTLFFENNGDGTFTESDDPLLTENTPDSFTSYADIDGDGDLDAFLGNGYSFDLDQDGKVFYFENTNPAPLTVAETSELFVVGGLATIIAPDLTITDEDNDDITFATVSISDFVSGAEELTFTPQDGIDGVFDDGTGVLTFIGKASASTYETLLRSVAINFTGTVPNARKSKAAASTLDLIQSITFQVRDTDFTLTTVAVVSISVIPGNELTIYNAVSPNKSDDMNSFLRIAAIETISPENTVTIYNRWGDVVFEVKNYNNSESARRFEGVNKNGKDLPSGTYFYKIEITGKTVTGYLSLKR